MSTKCLAARTGGSGQTGSCPSPCGSRRVRPPTSSDTHLRYGAVACCGSATCRLDDGTMIGSSRILDV
eukprot:25511-Eustigmatos_ZCMA.PRE.1